MKRDETLQRIDHATDEAEVMLALRDFITDASNGHDPRLGTLLGTASDVPGIALELTRFRLAARTNELGTADLEAVFARASVRIAELHDHTGGWKTYRMRSAAQPEADADIENPPPAPDPGKKTNGAP